MFVRLSRNRLVFGVAFAGVAASAIFWGRDRSLSRATAQQPVLQSSANQPATSFGQASATDDAKRVVAYIYGSTALTRGDFGEYLIARLGAERLENFINHCIIEAACKQKGVEVTAAEVEAEFSTMLAGLNTTQEKFEKTMLKPYNKTLYEWKEDAIKPRLQLTKLCRERVVVADEEMQKAFEARYGEQVECQMIMWAQNEEKVAFQAYDKLRHSEVEFERACRSQASPTLAAQNGRVKPFGRHSTGNEELERVAFSLQAGEMSSVMGTREGPVVIKCLSHTPPRKDKSLTDPVVRDEITKMVFEKRLQLEIQKLFSEMRTQANPQKFLSQAITEDELKRQALHEIQSDRKAEQKAGSPFQGN